MKYLPLLGSLIFVLCMCNVQKKKAIGYIDYRGELDSVLSAYSTTKGSNQKLNLCHIFDKAAWDSIAVIRSYLPKEFLSSFDLDVTSQVKDSMEYVIGVEWAQGLLFFNGNSVSHYAVIPGNPSFSKIDALSPVAVPILRRSDCEVVFAKVVSPNGDQSFFFVPVELVSKPSGLQPAKSTNRSLDSLLTK